MDKSLLRPRLLSCFISISIFVLGMVTSVVFGITFHHGAKYNRIQFSTNDGLYDSHLLYHECRKTLESLARSINTAKQNVRGTKTSDKLSSSIATLKGMLPKFNLSYDRITAKSVVPSKSVCPEVYMGTQYGYPSYDTGWVVANCSFSKPLSSLLTIVNNMPHVGSHSFRTFILSMKQTFENVKIFANVGNKTDMGDMKDVYNYHVDGTEGQALNVLADAVDTPYILIARDVVSFSSDARVERLIRQIERLNLSAASGAYRNTSGHWFVGCHQSVLRNYTLVYEAGYDESVEECQYCDYVDGPFVMETRLLQTVRFNENLTREGLFEDFFLRLRRKGEIAVCPDSMFHVDKKERLLNVQKWMPFAELRNLVKIKFSGANLNFPCSFSTPCYTMNSSSLHPCCQKALAEAINDVFNVCKMLNIKCQVFSGTSLGSAKMAAILPWELDADIAYDKKNFGKILQTLPKIQKMGYSVKVNKEKQTLILKTRQIHVEMFRYQNITIEKDTGISLTKTNIDGHWITNFRNPGLYVRNRFGSEIYQHSQSWIVTGAKSSWMTYKTNFFQKCEQEGWQACLDRYNGDGILQFSLDPIP